MKEKIKNLSNKKIVIISLCVFAIVLLLGFTYAYWSRTFNQTGENISTYDCFDISFSENTDGISMESGYPITDEEGLKTESYEVTITNTCKTAASYNVVLNKLNTSTLADEHIRVAVNGNVKSLSDANTTTSTIANASEAKIINSGTLDGRKSVLLKVQNWMDVNTSESEGSNKTFSYKISVEAIAGNKQLESLILANNKLYDEPIDFGIPILSKESFDKLSEEEQYDYTTESGLFTSEDDDGKTYYFRGVVENNYVVFKNLNYTEDKKGYQLHSSNDLTGCKRNWRDFCESQITTAGEPMVFRILRINGDKSIRLILDKPIASSTWTDEINDSDNEETLNDHLDAFAYSHKERIGYKDVLVTTTPENPKYAKCDSCYYADSYSFDKTTGKYSLNNPTLVTRQECESNNSLCTNKYYFYSTDVNYKSNLIYKFENDFTSRVHMARSVYKDGTEIKSNVKKKVDEWYEQNLKSYDNKLIESKFCNDTRTRYGSPFVYFGKYLTSEQNSFKCLQTNEDFGGTYNLKVGILSEDEVEFVGIANGTSETFLGQMPREWTMTPKKQYTPWMAVFNSGSLGSSGLNSSSASGAKNTLVRPVINLKSNVKIIGGDGSKDNPYVIG